MAPRRHVATIIATGAAALFAAPMAFAKTPGMTYCSREVCHRVKTIFETAKDVGRPAHVLASYYDVPWRDKFNPSLATSSGETFRALDADTAASPIYPDGTRLLVFAPRSGGAAVVRGRPAREIRLRRMRRGGLGEEDTAARVRRMRRADAYGVTANG